MAACSNPFCKLTFVNQVKECGNCMAQYCKFCKLDHMFLCTHCQKVMCSQCVWRDGPPFCSSRCFKEYEHEMYEDLCEPGDYLASEDTYSEEHEFCSDDPDASFIDDDYSEPEEGEIID